MKKTLLLLLLLCVSTLNAQDYFPTNTGVKTTENTSVAITNAKIYITPTKTVKKGTLLIKNGKVIAVGKKVKIPKGTQIIDVSGKIIYPSFVELYSDFGMRKPKPASNSGGRPQYGASRKGYYWNDHIRPETNSFDNFSFDSSKSKELLKAGFGVVNTHLQDGIIRGNGILVALDSTSTNAYRIIDMRSAQYLSFKKSAKSRQAYPSSLMGSMALLRQVYLDSDWYANGNAKNKDISLEALNTNKDLVQIFDAGGSNLNSLRADKVGDEFGIQYTIIGSGTEYERIDEIKRSNAQFIIPINFRDTYDVSNVYLANQLELNNMRRWNQEPSNLAVLDRNGVQFAISTHKLKKIGDFKKNIQKAIKYGLDKTVALQSLTTIPAKILGKSSEIGTLQKGSYANFLITSGDIFDSKTTIYENWVQGSKNVINDINAKDVSGNYILSFNNKKFNFSITGEAAKHSATVKDGDKKLKSKFSFKDNWIEITLNNQKDSTTFKRFVGTFNDINKSLSGKVVDENGEESSWTAVKEERKKVKGKKKKNKKEKKELVVLPVTYPNIGYGFSEKPKQETILFKNVTVWTGESEGILENTDVLLKGGEISEIGKNLKERSAKIIDGTGKHLTAGIIDEHSHIATSAVNESGHNSTAEVTIEDVVNPEDINIYRNLAGGVTSIQILHGSANPIGGRSAIIKLKWGEPANNMIYKDSPKFIKFALGENVKQSNWGQNVTVRFPQTRMGVEQVFIDYFQRAKEYDALKKSGKPYRKDVELETLAEIINKERFISCHSYVQSEINMLMKVAEKFNFNINTFTHILEGYKVADKMKKHGVGGSTFSDWWAYKYEVNDAIPYNAAIMHKRGVTVAINSDDAEMSRRLNQETAKTVKYGGVSEIDAWKFVTINPAKLLHIDDKVGSIKIGKDADVVLWSGHPMSVYSKVEKTIIDGIVYFDLEKDLEKRVSIKKERSQLINMMLNEKINGGKVQLPKKKVKKEFHCETIGNNYEL